MSGNDRSVNLGDLAARAQAGPQPRQGANGCRNPECRNGLTPGAVATGGGTKGAPLFGPGGVGVGKLMRWSWVNCLACNPPEGARKAGAVYKHLNLSEDEIARRAALATARASYQPPLSQSLGKLTQRSGAGSSAPTEQNAGKLAELLEQNKQLNERLGEVLKQNASMTDTLSRMAMQVAALIEDNAKLRAQAPGSLGSIASNVRETLTLPNKGTT